MRVERIEVGILGPGRVRQTGTHPMGWQEVSFIYLFIYLFTYRNRQRLRDQNESNVWLLCHAEHGYSPGGHKWSRSRSGVSAFS